MKLKIFRFNPLQENTYVIYDENLRGAIVDAGNCDDSENSQLERFVKGEGIHIERILCTHLHFDHLMGAGFASDTFGADIYGNPADWVWLEKFPHYAAAFGAQKPQTISVRGTLFGGERFQVGSLEFEVLALPGHSPGGLGYYMPKEGILFSGDSLFQGSIGRTDLEGGSYASLIESLRARVLTLPDDTLVYPGHGPSTTVAAEKQYNNYL